MTMYKNYETGEFETAEEHFDYRFEHSWMNWIPDFEEQAEENNIDIDRAEEAHAIEFDFEHQTWHANPEVDIWDFANEEEN